MEKLLGLTTKDAKEMIGQTIKWNVSGYRGQNYYENFQIHKGR